jgi:hypothetical protein
MKPALVIASPVIAFCVVIALALFHQAEALVNPEGYTSASPEDLTIEILEGRTEVEGSIETHWLRARVLAVHKSQSGLKPGDEIGISYGRDLEYLEEIDDWFEEKSKEPGWAGETPPYPPHAPAVGQKMRAYLKLKTDENPRSYQPAANQYSFEPL